MTNFILFFNSFASYVVLLAIFVALTLIAVNIGTSMRKKKNLQEGLVSETASNATE
ncbi:MAG: hypothetical protein R3Y54_08610 [Eubacteriales bacterium]